MCVWARAHAGLLVLFFFSFYKVKTIYLYQVIILCVNLCLKYVSSLFRRKAVQLLKMRIKTSAKCSCDNTSNLFVIGTLKTDKEVINTIRVKITSSSNE